MDSSISFKSKINFVKFSEFKEIIKDSPQFVTWGTEAPLYENAPRFHTEEIRICTAGGFHDLTKTREFHWLDDLTNFRMAKYYLPKMVQDFDLSETQALLVGSKDIKDRIYSRDLFKQIKDFFVERFKNLTIFEEHSYKLGETNLHFDLNTDTYTMCTRNVEPDEHGVPVSIVTLEKLKKAYKNIQISPKDELFINGKKVDL